jgi:hypothetical protein
MHDAAHISFVHEANRRADNKKINTYLKKINAAPIKVSTITTFR